MAVVKEIMGCSMVDGSSFVSSSKVLLNHGFQQRNQLLGRPLWVPLEKRGLHLRRVVRQPVAAVSEDLMKASAVPAEKAVKFKVRAVLTVKKKNKEDLKETLVKHLDSLTDKIGRNVVLELISTEIDPKTRAPRKSTPAVVKDWSKKTNIKAERVNYTAEFTVDSNFGDPGAITVTNKHQKEFFLESITIEGFACGPVHFPCNSWVQSKKDHPGKRLFFSNKPYLPGETPAGLRALREQELRDLRGDGKGVRKLSDRIYDYDVYNDLGNPDNGINSARPMLGGEKIPFPRRCRTGRPPSETDMHAESRVEQPFPMYVPRDEQFEEVKQDTFSDMRAKAVLHNLIPGLKASMLADKQDFKLFTDIDCLYKDDSKVGLHDEQLKKLPLPPKVIDTIQESSQGIFRYNTPKILTKDKFAWLRDDEFARQAIAGINPVNIEKLKVFPPVSNLDPEVHGPQESALKEEHIVGHLNGMTIEQALEENKLFIVDFHDIYLPFLDRINSLDGRKAYATRTIFFLTPVGTLKPIAIELSLPPSAPITRAKRVITPPVDATSDWTWKLAKAHVCSNDAGVHQLVNHWLRTHACMEPFILAAHRQLSAMHPIFKLLDPHMRYTLEINGMARQTLINADGRVSPADLIRRGMAVPDPTQPHGLKLLIEDYPYANDGLLIWGAIENWVKTYVAHYYPSPSVVISDRELQAWYSEAVNVGHADLRHAAWWPSLSTPDDLASILTTLIWLASAQHAALNFGQYPYGGYVPNRPPLMRRLIPEPTDPEYTNFLNDPQRYYLSALPGVLQSTSFMAVVDTLSTHSPDEEYIGERNHPSTWSGDAEIIEASYEFSAEIRRIEKEIEKRNAEFSRRNRCGAGVLPYELLAPSSGPGVTCRGIPNSVSI
ncbi:Linoleate 13S-lipoxygenase 3-1, chloroplastic [Vitis vinifera]|uniref:Lipoxygenase n=1 Tax=Vitis vinifera TaxID=29760 RepID=A0A438K6X7_VITVI|nr:Linoleate 13S-lipoxygenase 3-1, chloroplastic [Vitis vinifera]